MLLAVALGGRITEADSGLCHQSCPQQAVQISGHMQALHLLRVAEASHEPSPTLCPPVGGSLLACVSPVRELLGAGAGPLTTAEPPAQAPQACRRQGDIKVSKAGEDAHVLGPAHPVLGIYSLGPLTQVHQDEYT